MFCNSAIQLSAVVGTQYHIPIWCKCAHHFLECFYLASDEVPCYSSEFVFVPRNQIRWSVDWALQEFYLTLYSIFKRFLTHQEFALVIRIPLEFALVIIRIPLDIYMGIFSIPLSSCATLVLWTIYHIMS